MGTAKSFIRYYCLPLILWPLFMWIFILLVPVYLVVYIIRRTEYFIYRSLYGAKLFPCEDVVWTMSTPQNELNINCCLIVKGILTIDNFRKLIDKCLIKSEDGKGNLLYWKATKIIYPGYLNYYWVDDELFDINDHVYELLDTVVSSEDELKNVISLHRSTKLILKNQGSPWEFVLIPYLDNGCRKTVIFSRLSHAIADGSALAYFLINCLGQYQHPCKEQTILKFSQGHQGISRTDRFLINLKGMWTLPVVQFDFLFSCADKNELHAKYASGNKILTWTNPIDLSLVKSIKNSLNTTVNDVLIGCLAKTLNDFFIESCCACPSEISVVFPFDIRSSPHEAKDFKNNVAVIVIRLLTKSSDLVTSIKMAKSRMDVIKNSCEPTGSFLCWKFLSFLLPRFMAKLFVFSTVNKTTGSLSNLAGPQQTITIDGNPVEMITFWSPQTNNQCFGTAFCSYNGFIRMGIEVDHYVSKDPQRICRMFEENIKKLGELTFE